MTRRRGSGEEKRRWANEYPIVQKAFSWRARRTLLIKTHAFALCACSRKFATRQNNGLSASCARQSSKTPGTAPPSTTPSRS